MMDAIHNNIKSLPSPPFHPNKKFSKNNFPLALRSTFRVFIILHAGIDLAGSIPLKKSLCFEKNIYIPKVT